MAKQRNNTQAKSMISQPMFRTRIARDRTKYNRKNKHRKSDKIEPEFSTKTQADIMSNKEESKEELHDRIRPLMDAVDLTNIHPRATASLDTSELSGLETIDDERRLLHLIVTDIITAEDGKKMARMVLK